jgi:uncharacterized protein (TIGR03118 family)
MRTPQNRQLSHPGSTFLYRQQIKKNKKNQKFHTMNTMKIGSPLLLAALILGATACHKNDNRPNTPLLAPGNFAQTNLVSDTTSYGAPTIDPTLKNPWGIAINNDAGIIWISSNHGSVTDVYDSTGKTLLGPFNIPSAGGAGAGAGAGGGGAAAPDGGAPTGVAYNATADFQIPGSTAATKFLFVGEDGIVSAWALGAAAAVKVADRSSVDAVYKGCAIANTAGANYLYAANFTGRSIDVFDKSFNLVTGPDFKDPAIPADFGPFNIANIGGLLYITYAKIEAGGDDDQAGAGNGYIDIFTPDGKLAHQFASQGALNSPWGIAQSTDGFGLPLHSIIVGNFGDGRINVFDSTGIYRGALQNNGQAIVIPGLWALDFYINDYPKASPSKLFFTAGPEGEQHGLFGYLRQP